ncbi:hypothetical protein M5K25_019842 [Dendrobium thyrsiflorum]|uniref:Gnk2-homologous domain-containing protein n=1 Tax=Dendrobium thyrsiflorum TaxID=117978 RepID=A0ABD0UFY9_DENTH
MYSHESALIAGIYYGIHRQRQIPPPPPAPTPPPSPRPLRRPHHPLLRRKHLHYLHQSPASQHQLRPLRPRKKNPQSGFAISSHGHLSTTIYGLTRCRGDIPADVCSSCITDAATQLPSLCPNRTDARIWYEYCFLRYDSDDFLGKSDTSYAVIVYNVENATDPVRFNEAVKELMGRVDEAAVRSSKSFGWGVTAFTNNVTVRGMAQCTRDLSPEVCRECLASAVGLFPDYCSYRKGCRVLYSSCVVRYEIYDFLFQTDSSSGSAGDLLRKRMILS